jgi:hypothetical protein
VLRLPSYVKCRQTSGSTAHLSLSPTASMLVILIQQILQPEWLSSFFQPNVTSAVVLIDTYSPPANLAPSTEHAKLLAPVLPAAPTFCSGYHPWTWTSLLPPGPEQWKACTGNRGATRDATRAYREHHPNGPSESSASLTGWSSSHLRSNGS